MPSDLPVVQDTEIALQAQRDKNQFDFAIRDLELTAQDRREFRQGFKHSQHIGFAMLIATIMGFVGFCWMALAYGKEALVVDVLKIAVSALGGGGVGYAVGVRKGKE